MSSYFRHKTSPGFALESNGETFAGSEDGMKGVNRRSVVTNRGDSKMKPPPPICLLARFRLRTGNGKLCFFEEQQHAK